MGQKAFPPNVQFPTPAMKVLRGTLGRDYAIIGTGFCVKDAGWILQQSFRVGMDVVDLPVMKLQVEASHQKILAVPGHDGQRIGCEA